MYSQNLEEQYILQAVGDGEQTSRFLDVGAWDGKTFSNTLALMERGWSGVLLEPGLDAFAALLRQHGGNDRLQLLHVALGFDHHLTEFWNSPDAVSTTDAAHYERWKSAGQFGPRYWTPQITWGELFNQFGGGYKFVNIDTEGTSVDLFIAMLDTGIRPECVCVEHDGRLINVLQAAQACGYKAIYTSGENVVLAL